MLMQSKAIDKMKMDPRFSKFMDLSNNINSKK